MENIRATYLIKDNTVALSRYIHEIMRWLDYPHITRDAYLEIYSEVRRLYGFFAMMGWEAKPTINTGTYENMVDGEIVRRRAVMFHLEGKECEGDISYTSVIRDEDDESKIRVGDWV